MKNISSPEDKLWDGRFSEKTDEAVEAFTASIDVDKRLYAYDIEGSIAHCKMLSRATIITEGEAELLISGLLKIKNDIAKGNFVFDQSLEDIHMHIETGLVREVGKTAQKLHTARSRNDQVALDVRLYLRDEVSTLNKGLVMLRRALVGIARENLDTVMPGYTHLQRAQPVLLAHHLMAYHEMFSRDADRLRDCLKRINVMPLGSAALAGTTYPIDREYTAALLGFDAIAANSIDAVSDRDFIIEFLAAASIAMVHLSRLSEELVLWSSSEFGFVELPDAYATGSSIMPQKKNPDVAELVRGKTGRVFGALTAVLTLMKSLPLAYNRDMQEDKQPLFDGVDTLKACIAIYAKLLPKLKIRKENMRQAATRGFLNATDLADYLVGRGMPFREAHGCVGRAVGFAYSLNKELDELPLEELKAFSPLIEADVFSRLSPEQVVNRRRSFGGIARQNVLSAIEAAEKRLDREADAAFKMSSG